MRRTLPFVIRLLPGLLPLIAAPALGQEIVRQPPSTPQQAAPAPALPGLAARRAPAPIQADPTLNLSPNAALFDAINRGDLGAARDALGRGANLGARNALGLTPVDAAVDQGRNDIAFYLLSAREASGAPAPTAPLPANRGGLNEPPVTAPPVAQAGPAPTPAGQAALAGQAVLTRRAAPGAASAAPGPRRAELWAGDGGAPRPEIGFLGFDAGRPAGAERSGRN